MSLNIFSNVGTTKIIIAAKTIMTKQNMAIGYVIADLTFALSEASASR